MLRIAVCDDESGQLIRMETLLGEYQALRPELELCRESFSSPAALLERLRTSSFDIYLLDILMPGRNGIELGMDIRRFDQAGHILYLSSSVDYAMDSYSPKASGYLLKPVDSGRLFPLLDGIVDLWLQENQSFATIKTRSGLRRVPIRSVVFGELVGHCVHYHLADGTVLEGMSVRTAFRDVVSNLLEHERFALCGASFFVNLSFVEGIGTSELQLVGGGTVPLSRALRADVTQRWLNYHLKGGRKP